MHLTLAAPPGMEQEARRVVGRLTSAGIADLLDAWDAPLGVLAMPSGPWMRLWAMVASDDGQRVVRADVTGSLDDPEGLAALMVRHLRARDLKEILAS